MDWRHRAACTQHDPEAFFPVSADPLAEGNPERAATLAALDLCWYRCQVRSECLADAEERGERFGVRGGFTEKQRNTLSRMVPAPRGEAP